MEAKKIWRTILLIGLLAFGCATVDIGFAANGPQAPANLRCEYLTNPMGIDVTHPRFSWVLEHGARGEKAQNCLPRLAVTALDQIDGNLAMAAQREGHAGKAGAKQSHGEGGEKSHRRKGAKSGRREARGEDFCRDQRRRDRVNRQRDRDLAHVTRDSEPRPQALSLPRIPHAPRSGSPARAKKHAPAHLEH